MEETMAWPEREPGPEPEATPEPGPEPGPATEPEEPEFVLPDEAKPALESASGFLTGEAGTGKTFMVRELASRRSGVFLCATTGIAAVNLQTTTINSLLGYYDTNSMQDNYVQGYLARKLKKLYDGGLRRLVLDEVSMMPAGQLMLLMQTVDEVNDEITGEDVGKATGAAPITVSLTGDFCQLPPVKAKFCFEAAQWERFVPNISRLKTIRRQADSLFIEALQAARRGVGVRTGEILAPCFSEQLDMRFDGTTIFAKNDEVDRFNAVRLAELTTPTGYFPSERWGAQKGEWKNIPEALGLKAGALVMVLSNLKDRDSRGARGAYKYVNGDLGILEGVGDHYGSAVKYAVVRLKRTGQQVAVEYVERAAWATLDSETEAEVKARHPDDWENYVSQNGLMVKVGAVNYMPLRLAWGTTVHKSQGLSLDRVQVNLRDGFFNAPGMAYVALSRGRSMAGLRLVGQPRVLVDKCRVDKRVLAWI